MGTGYSGNSKQIEELRRLIALCAGIGLGAESLYGPQDDRDAPIRPCPGVHGAMC